MRFSEPGKCGQKSYDPTTLWPTRRLRQVAGATNKEIPRALVGEGADYGACMPAAARPLVCGIASPEAGGLARFAAAQASRLGVGLVLAHAAEAPYVADRPFSSQSERIREAEELKRAGLMQQVLEPVAEGIGEEVEALVRFEEPARALREAAAEHGATLLVVGHRRLGALDRVVVGSTSGALVREAPCPVLVVAEGSGDSWEEACPVIVCGVDGSDDADHAARTAAALAKRCDYALVLASVSEAGDLDLARTVATAELIAGPSRVKVEHRDGDAAGELAESGRRHRAALVVVGSRGRGAVRAAVLGSVSNRLLELAGGPVVVVPPGAAIPDAPGG